MADKEITIQVTTTADASQLDDLQGKIEEIMENTDVDFEINVDDTSIEQATNDTDELTDSLNNAENSVEGLADSMGLIEGTMMLDLANQVGAMGDSAEGMAQEMNTASITVGQLATQTGIAEPQLTNMINYISNATFPQNEAMAYVGALNQMGVSADKLADSATNMDRINDATGIGYGKVMQLTAGLQSMGITADNLPTAFNAIAYAESNVFNGTDTLQQVLKTQAGTINEYGLNVDQLVVVLSTLQSQTGLTGRKLSSELATRLKDCNGDVTALEQSLGLQAGALQNASQITGQYSGQLQQLANEEAEHKTIVDQINSAWEDMQLLLSPLLSPLTSVIGLIGQFGQFALSINSLITLANTFGITKNSLMALIPVQYAEGTAGWFSIGWIALAILLGIALGLALIYLWNNSEQFRNGVIWLGNSLKWLAGIIVSSIMNAVNNFRNTIMGIPKAIQACLQWAYNLIMNHPIVKALQWLGQQAVYAFNVLGLGQHSPGKIYKGMKLELDSVEDLTEDYGSILPSKYMKLGETISKDFNPNLNASINQINKDEFEDNLIARSSKNINDDEKSGMNVIFNIDYLAKKEFADDIIEIMQKYFAWDNETAGRRTI